MRNCPHPDNPSNIEAANEWFETALDLAQKGEKRIRPAPFMDKVLLYTLIRDTMAHATQSLIDHAKSRFEIDET